MPGVSRRLAAALLLLGLCVFPSFLFAADPDPVAAESVSPSIDPARMMSLGRMAMLGVRAEAFVAPTSISDKPEITHRVVVRLVNEKTGRPVEKAQVGLKLRRLYGETLDPVWMHASESQPELFSADVSLPQQGAWLLIVGSRLQDEKKRQFTFEYTFR